MNKAKLSLWTGFALIAGALSFPAGVNAAVVSATPAVVWPGAKVRLQASGFEPRSRGVASLTGVRNVRFRVDGRGRASVVLAVPVRARAGRRGLRVRAGRRRISTTLSFVAARRPASTMVVLSGGQRVLLDPARARAGERFTLKATGFARRAILDVRFAGASVARRRTNPKGALTIVRPVPRVAAGARMVRVVSKRTVVNLRFVVLASLPAPPPPLPPPAQPPPAQPPPAQPSAPRVAAAGDIACSPNDPNFHGGLGTPSACRQQATSDLLVGRGYSAVLTLGDTQYDCNTAADFAGSFHPSWGRVKPIIHPVAGNHEYKDTNPDDYGMDGCVPNAGGYFGYFGAAAGDPSLGYYSFEIGNWHVIALNTNVASATGCPVISCAQGSPQEQWLRADLAAHPTACTLAIWHHPLFSSKTASTASRPFWDDLYVAGAEIVLNAHVHNYERFRPQRPDGAADPAGGIAQFVVGTGGKSLESTGSPGPGSNSAAAAQTFGVLELTLKATSYEWRFVPEAGQTFSDAGSAACH
ncbi:MAG: metallophosphoesterase [Chloroflexi bacterium]|nr:metallophosphoesterase [Chloroflexota bacterium]